MRRRIGIGAKVYPVINDIAEAKFLMQTEYKHHNLGEIFIAKIFRSFGRSRPMNFIREESWQNGSNNWVKRIRKRTRKLQMCIFLEWFS